MKRYECVKVDHHKNVGKTIGEWRENGWLLRMYSCAQVGMVEIINHYLLFERNE